MKLEIEVPKEHRKEIREQLYADKYYDGFNKDVLLIECILEEIGITDEQLCIQ